VKLRLFGFDSEKFLYRDAFRVPLLPFKVPLLPFKVPLLPFKVPLLPFKVPLLPFCSIKSDAKL